MKDIQASLRGHSDRSEVIKTPNSSAFIAVPARGRDPPVSPVRKCIHKNNISLYLYTSVHLLHQLLLIVMEGRNRIYATIEVHPDIFKHQYFFSLDKTGPENRDPSSKVVRI